MVSLPVVPVADPAAFGVIMLNATLGLEEIGGFPYNIISILTLLIWREVLPASPVWDPKREGGSLGYVGRGSRLAPFAAAAAAAAAAADADPGFHDSSGRLLSNVGCAPANFGKITS